MGGARGAGGMLHTPFQGLVASLAGPMGVVWTAAGLEPGGRVWQAGEVEAVHRVRMAQESPGSLQADFLHILQPLNLKEGESETQMQAAWAGRLLSTAALVQPQWELQRTPPGFLPAARPLLPVATVSLQTTGAATEASHMVHIHSAGEDQHPGEGFKLTRAQMSGPLRLRSTGRDPAWLRTHSVHPQLRTP